LASKGIDAKLVDERIQKKATTIHYTKVRKMVIIIAMYNYEILSFVITHTLIIILAKTFVSLFV